MKEPEGQQTKTTPITDQDLADFRALKRDRARQRRTSLLIYHRDGVTVVPLEEGQGVVIGRGAPADVAVRDPSLSREHACVELLDGEVWVEDLDSTNGTLLNGQRIERTLVSPDDELTLGVVAAVVHKRSAGEAQRVGLEGHDRFVAELEREASRGRTFGRSVALMLVRGDRRRGGHPGRWIPAVQRLLRPFDRVALYSADTAEILLPEVGEQGARELADALLVAAGRPLRVGLALLPAHAASAEELLDVTRAALLRATAKQPLNTAETTGAAAAAAPATGSGLDQQGDTGPVFASPAMQEVKRTVERLSSSVIPVLLLGETGTGKEVVARAIHDGGPRRGAPMICVNCGAIPGQLVESTLFGHEKGAFTGASQQAKGVFEAAGGGTVLLDEIGELPAATQIALLRVLEAKRITRVGSNKELEVDVRILAATHRDLEAMCRAGAFREDLLYRLNTMTLKVPPLRARPEEIEPLARRFVEQANQSNGCQIQGVDAAAMELLKAYAWPGNVRELRNAIERAVVIAQGEVITVDDLPERVRGLAAAPAPMAQEPAGGAGGGEDLQSSLQCYESKLILTALEETGWDRKAAACRLGLPLRTLARRMQTHGIKRTGYSQDSEPET